MTATAASPRFELVRLADLTPSSTRAQIERRDHFDDGALRELAASIASVGILQPLVVRPRDEGGYEIVAGERRFLAAQIAGIELVPVNVVALSDEQLIEAQLVENLQREGLHELAEAEGYEALLQSHAFTVDDLAAKFGKSRAYIYGRMNARAAGRASTSGMADGKNSMTGVAGPLRAASAAVRRSRMTFATRPERTTWSRCNGQSAQADQGLPRPVAGRDRCDEQVQGARGAGRRTDR